MITVSKIIFASILPQSTNRTNITYKTLKNLKNGLHFLKNLPPREKANISFYPNIKSLRIF